MMTNSKLLNELAQGLVIDKHNLDEHWVRLPQLFRTVSDECVTANTERDRAKAAIDEVHAELDKKFRQEASDRQEKMTEGRLSQAPMT